MRRSIVTALAFVLALGVGASRASASVISWTDWISATPTSAAGVLPGIGVTYTGQVSSPTQTAGGINYWNPATPYLSGTVGNAPPCCDIITLTGGPNAGTSTLTFSTPITDPIMAIVSLGQPGVPVDYDFNSPFTILSFGAGYWGGGGPGSFVQLPGDVLRGVEGHGAIQFNGTFSSISWTMPNQEFWHGFTVGQVTQVPEPMTLGLFGMAVVSGLVRRARRRI